jgi:hypothetical protein
MTTDFERRGGVLRAVLTEPEWRALAGPAHQLPVPLRSIPSGQDASTSSASVAGPALTQAVGLLTSPQPFRAVVSSTVTDGSSYGLLASIAADGAAGAMAIRALVPSQSVADLSGDGPVAAAEGVQLRAFPPDRLVAETLRLFPPDPPRVGLGAVPPEDRPGTPVLSMSATDARALARAVADDDQALLAGVADLNGWDEVPPLLVSLAERIRATVTLSLQQVGRPTLHATWLQCDLGWAHTSVRGGRVRHQLRTRTEIGDDLISLYAGAYTLAGRAARSAS